MTLIKKFSASLLAVALVASMAIGLLGETRRAEAAITLLDFTAPVQAAGLTETWTVGFTSSVVIPASSTITVTFPTNFTTTGVTASGVTLGGAAFAGVGVASVNAATNGSIVITTTAVATTAAPSAGTITIANIVNGPVATYTGATTATATAGFALVASAGETTAVADATPPQLWNTTVTKSPTTSVQADGSSSVQLTFTTSNGATLSNTGSGATQSLTLSTDIGTFTQTPTVGGTLGTPVAITTPVTSNASTVAAAITAGATLTANLKAPSTAGTATVVLRAVPANGGNAVVIGSTQVTFVTATALPGAVASLSVVPAATAVSNTAANTVVITALDANGTQVLNGTTITVTSSNGTFTTCPGGTVGSGVCTTSVQANGAVTVAVTGSGVSGTQTITATAGSVTGTATVTLTGTTAGSLALDVRAANPTTGAASTTGGAKTPARCGAYVLTTCNQNIASATVKDAAGNNAPGIVVTWSVTPADGVVTFVTPQTDTAITTSTSSAVSTILGQARAGIKVATTGVAGTVYTIKATAPTATGTTEATTTITLGDTFSATAAAAVITITAPDVAVAGVSTITVDVLGAAGKAVGDGTSVQLVTSDGAVANVANGQPTGPNPAFTVNGKATFTFVAPSTPGTINATALISTKAQSKTFAVGGTTPTPGTGGSFSGGTIAPSGVSIVSFTGSLTELGTAGTAAKVVSVTATVGGKMITYVVGAPAFVNADFSAAFPTGLSGTLVIVKTGA